MQESALPAHAAEQRGGVQAERGILQYVARIGFASVVGRAATSTSSRTLDTRTRPGASRRPLTTVVPHAAIGAENPTLGQELR
jgi:hypothetical protein